MRHYHFHSVMSAQATAGASMDITIPWSFGWRSVFGRKNSLSITSTPKNRSCEGMAVCVRVYIYICVHSQTHHAYVYTCVYVCICMHVQSCICIYMYLYLYICTCNYLHFISAMASRDSDTVTSYQFSASLNPPAKRCCGSQWSHSKCAA